MASRPRGHADAGGGRGSGGEKKAGDDDDDDDDDARGYVTHATWAKQLALSRHVGRLPMRDKRTVFHMLRFDGVEEDSFLPRLGVTAGGFCVWQILQSKQASAPP